MAELKPPPQNVRPTLYHRLIRRLLRPIFIRMESAEATLGQHQELIVAGRAQADLANAQNFERMDAVSLRVERSETGVARLLSELGEVRSTTEDAARRFERRLAELDARQTGLDAAIRELNHSVTQARELDRSELAEASRKTGEEIAQLRVEVLPRLHTLSGFQSLAEGRLSALTEFQGLAEGRLSALSEHQRLTESRLSDLSGFQSIAEDRFSEWSVRSGELQSRVDKSSSRIEGINAQLHELLPPGTDAFDYTGFEDRFRGSEALIAERQAGYLPLLTGRAPVADLGCGRGELLGLLQAAGIAAVGVDADAAQAARCRDKGLNVEQAELLQWIAAREAGSLGALVALQVVEHLSFTNSLRLIQHAHRVLRPDGMVLFETVNPHCPEAMEWFYIDPTHRQPVYPELLKFLLEQQGFIDIRVNFHVATSTAVPGEPLNDKTGGDFSITGIRK